MDAAKDLLKRAVELDSAQRYSEAIICYEEGIQNILRAIGGILQLRILCVSCMNCVCFMPVATLCSVLTPFIVVIL